MARHCQRFSPDQLSLVAKVRFAEDGEKGISFNAMRAYPYFTHALNFCSPLRALAESAAELLSDADMLFSPTKLLPSAFVSLLGSLSFAQNPALVQQTLNPLPDSVLIPSSLFSGSLVGYVDFDTTNFILYSGVGDLTGDRFPEVMFTGWSYRGWDATGTPPPTPILLMSTSATGVTQIDPLTLLGTAEVAGTTQPRILDLNNDGRNDFFYLGHNESPFVPTLSEVFLQTAGGTFTRSALAGPKQESHNSNLGDFNGDGFVDVVASSYGSEEGFYAAELASGVLPDPTNPGWAYPMLYLNQQDGTFAAIPLVTTDPVGGWLQNLGSGSASAMADFDGDGRMDVVVVDGRQDANNWAKGDSWLFTDITIENGVGKAKLKALPAPYFDRDGTYASYPSMSGDEKSHDIKVDTVDVNNDGRPDIVVSVMLWADGVGTQAGVLQVLLNQGGLEFTDATDTTLYNFFLGASSSHETEFVDLNGDGFLDIFASDPYGASEQVDGTWSSKPQTWATRILINTGTGKFVQAMWNEFREFTLAQRALANDTNLSRFDNVYARYDLPDGRFGLITRQMGYAASNFSQPRTALFDYRATVKLSTGPNGTNPALVGEPGFSEYFYLTQYPEVAAAVTAGQYASGLAHYRAVGKSEGKEAFAPNARIAGSAQADTLTLRGNGAGFEITHIAGGYHVKDTAGGYGTLTLRDIEKIQFADQLVDLSTLPFAAPSRSEVLGGSASFFTAADGAIQWRRNGANLPAAASATLTVSDIQSADTGVYTPADPADGAAMARAAILGLSTTEKVVGDGVEISADVPHPNTNIFDQVLLTGVAESITADFAQGQITRTSFIDLNNDIVQVEFSGPGTLSLVLDASSAPAAPTHYNQPAVNYMKGHAGIVITGADERTNVSVFTVGRATAFDFTGGYNILLAPSETNDPAKNGSPLFIGHDATVYDGFADIAFIAISSTNGKFGGVRTANANYFATKGLTGLYAPGVAFQGPVYLGNVSAFDDATPVIVIGSATGNTWINGGDLVQDNGRAVQVSGLTQLHFKAGSDSHGNLLAAKANQARLEQNGTDVTAQIVVNP